MKRALTTVLIAAAPALSVQEAQKHFPEWAALHDDLFATNLFHHLWPRARNRDRAPERPTDPTCGIQEKRAAPKNRRIVSENPISQPI
jgi:hypothetical protein